MQFQRLVRPEHLNHHGNLFGGYMLLWVDEYAYIAVLHDYPSGHFVTRAMSAASFTQGVNDGDVLTFDVKRTHVGTCSVTYDVQVFALEIPEGTYRNVFNTSITMCNTDTKGKKAPLPLQ